MKKKLIAVMLCITMCLLGCGNKRPDTVSEGMYLIGCKALKISDKYINSDLSSDEAYDELSSLSSQATNSVDDDYEQDLLISVSVSSLSSDLWSMKKPFGTKSTLADFKKHRDTLADYLK